MINEQDSGESTSERASSTDMVETEVAVEEELEQEAGRTDASQDKTEEQTEGDEKGPWRTRPADQQQRPSRSEKRAAADDEDAEDEEDFEDEDTGEHEHGDSDEQDDPLGAAYDLERGDILKPTEVEHRALPWKSKIASPKEFFGTEILYRHDILEDADRDLLRGKYRVELKGFQGGVWTVDLGEEISVTNRAEDADVILSMQQKDFIDLVNGMLSPQLAMLSKKIRVTGDVKKGDSLPIPFSSKC